MKITVPKPTITVPRNNTTSSSSSTYRSSSTSGYRYRRSWWSRFNEGVADLGNWFSDNAEDVSTWLTIAAIAIASAAAIIYFIAAWVTEGFWIALIFGVILAIVGSLGLGILVSVLAIAVNVIMFAFRLLFWNGWTLLGIIGLALGGWMYAYLTVPTYDSYYDEPVAVEEVVASPDGTYRCTAKVLNIRYYRDKNSNIMGCLYRGQTVEVTDIDDEFGSIQYNGMTGYVCMDYMERVE